MPDILHSASQGGYDDEGLRRPLPQEDWPYNGRPNGGSDRRYGDHGPRFEKNIYIRKDQILFDIDTQMSIVAKARRRQDDTEEETLSSGSSPYQSLFERWIDRYSGLAKGVMSAFVLERAHKGEMNDIKGETEQTITLLMPAYWDDTVFQQLSAVFYVLRLFKGAARNRNTSFIQHHQQSFGDEPWATMGRCEDNVHPWF